MGPELVGLKANEWTYKRGIYVMPPVRRGGSYVCLPSVCRLSATVWGLRVDEGIDEGRRGYLPLISNTLPLHSLAPDFKHFAPSFKLCP
jgi:hypothetical protein